ncbi:alpha/beta hydrolase [Chitinophaga sp. XS-30]|uniref:alpha/beta hydrolase n=1 Tax=Chitinophaga sp. XS-30 TaxID=2604421 RepID=UPI0011DDDE2F|nr:alpha/beta hydrolase [Chitinophaga sp. XS-30]QEH41330.1 alpha/beta hydrolase fold domain-containing protein [Chitinophaga sp. XS-30]
MRSLLLLLLTGSVAQAQTRITYDIKGEDTLYMDHYAPSGNPNGMSVIFVHGGGFSSGDPKNQRPFAEGMSRRGYNIFVISYRLYLKDSSFSCNTPTPVKLKAVRLAVEDAADASKYIISNAASLQVDTGRLFIAGSSAGAETILQLLYNPFASSDPARFDFFRQQRFKGAMVFAGALIDINTMRKDNYIPTLLMHGTKDQLVPFGTAAHHYCNGNAAGWLMLFGAKTIYEQVKSWRKQVVLYTYEGKGHEVSNRMFREFEKMDGFMKSVAAGKKIGAREFFVND